MTAHTGKPNHMCEMYTPHKVRRGTPSSKKGKFII